MSDLIDSALTKDIEDMVTKLSRRLAEASPYLFVHEKVMFHVNRDPTILSKILRLYSSSRLAMKTDSLNSAEKVKLSVPRVSMDEIMNEHFTRTSSMTTLYVVMIADALRKFDVSYSVTSGFKDTTREGEGDDNTNDCRRKAFVSDTKGFSWIDVFANDDNLVFAGTLKRFNYTKFSSQFIYEFIS